jgi:hypothetical protein
MATKSRRQKTRDTGDLASSLQSNPLLKAIGGIANPESYRGLAKRRAAPASMSVKDASSMYGNELSNREPAKKAAPKKPPVKKAALGGHRGA